MSEFTHNQETQIKLGKSEGLDVSAYAKPEYNVMQMTQIRLGLLAGLDVSVYADTVYDWFQMEEIRKGLADGVDISVYATPDIPYEKMREIRIGLTRGINLKPFINLSAGNLREARRAVEAGVNIKEYIAQGYEPEQLGAIIDALAKQLDIGKYISKEFRGIAITEIANGLEIGVDVSVYASLDYDWRQMREIRLGLESRVDVSLYLNPYFGWQQMQEIRTGLEEGLDVSEYARLMYTAGDMKSRREQLERISAEKKPEQAQAQKEYDELLEKRYTTNGILVLLGTEEMEASVLVSDDCIGIPKDIMIQLLKSHGVISGYDERAIEDIIDGRYKPGDMVIVARGLMPTAGADGRYEFLFRTEVARTPRIREDGSVDYQNIEWYETVSKGQTVVRYIPAARGNVGHTVTGKQVPGLSGRELKMLRGRGFKVLDDKMTYVALHDGSVELHGDELIISQLFVFEEVTMATGNVNVEGNVYIKGRVGSGVIVKASGEIAVDGFVESAIVESKSDIFIRKGVNAGGSGYIKADGNVAGVFFESAAVYAGGDIYCNYCMDSKLQAEGKVVLSGDKGSAIGGQIIGRQGIHASSLGNRSGVGTFIQIGADDAVRQMAVRIDNKIADVNKELETLKNAWADMRDKYAPEVRNTMELYIMIENAIYTKEKEHGELDEAKRSLMEKIHISDIASVYVRGKVYDGVVFRIDGMTWKASEVANITVRKTNNRIALYRNM